MRTMLVLLLFPALALAQPDPKFPRGAKPSPRFKLQAAQPFRPTATAPAQFCIVPPQLSYWRNNVSGCCVTSQEAFSKAVWSIQCGLPELFVPDAEVERWAKKNGAWNGATLTGVMDRMQKSGFVVDGVNYKDGPYKGVDYSDETVLQAAIATGPVNIAIDADALPNDAGVKQGWYATGNGRFPDTDHCVALCGYGPAPFLYQSLNVAMPTALTGKSGYLLFTWGTIGFVDHQWLMSTCVEAWVRSPTTPGQNPTPPPATVAVPNLVGMKFSAAQTACAAVGLTCSLTEGDPARPISAQVPGAGAIVAPGSTVTVTSVPAPQPPPVPPPTPGDIVIRVPAGTKPGTYVVGESGLSKEDAEAIRKAQEVIDAILNKYKQKPPEPEPEDYEQIKASAKRDRAQVAFFVNQPARQLPGVRCHAGVDSTGRPHVYLLTPGGADMLGLDVPGVPADVVLLGKLSRVPRAALLAAVCWT